MGELNITFDLETCALCPTAAVMSIGAVAWNADFNSIKVRLEPQSDDVSNLSSHMVLYNKDRALTLSGPMFDRPQMDVRLAAYTFVFYPSHLLNSTADWGNSLRNILFPDVLRQRKKIFAGGIKRIKDRELDRFIHLEFPPFRE